MSNIPIIQKNLSLHGYRNLGRIGKGSYGEALLVSSKTGEKFVCKIINLSRLNRQETDCAHDEVSLLSQIVHAFIVSFVSTFSGNNRLFIVMAHCEGGDIQQKTEKMRKKGERFTQKQIQRYTTQIAMALNHLHGSKILHRDVKPSNMFMTSEQDIIKLGDFGISKQLSGTLDFASTRIGTPFYLSPEICSNEKYGPPSDIWSFGCLLYEICRFEVPFTLATSNLAQLISQIANPKKEVPKIGSCGGRYDSELEDLIYKCMDRSPATRLTCTQILEFPFLSEDVRNMETFVREHLRIHQMKAKSENYSVDQEVCYYSTTNKCWIKAVIVDMHPSKGVRLDVKKDVWISYAQMSAVVRNRGSSKTPTLPKISPPTHSQPAPVRKIYRRLSEPYNLAIPQENGPKRCPSAMPVGFRRRAPNTSLSARPSPKEEQSKSRKETPHTRANTPHTAPKNPNPSNGQSSKSIQSPRPEQESKSIQSPRTGKSSKGIQSPRTGQSSNRVQSPRAAQNSRSAQSPRSSQNCKLGQSPRTGESSKGVQSPRKSQGLKGAQSPRTGQPARCAQSPRGKSPSGPYFSPNQAHASPRTDSSVQKAGIQWSKSPVPYAKPPLPFLPNESKLAKSPRIRFYVELPSLRSEKNHVTPMTRGNMSRGDHRPRRCETPEHPPTPRILVPKNNRQSSERPRQAKYSGHNKVNFRATPPNLRALEKLRKSPLNPVPAKKKERSGTPEPPPSPHLLPIKVTRGHSEKPRPHKVGKACYPPESNKKKRYALPSISDEKQPLFEWNNRPITPQKRAPRNEWR